MAFPWWWAVSFLVALVFGIGCERKADVDRAKPPHIVVITVDTLRADRLGCYGYDRAQTPHIDKLADEGVLVERAIAAAPLTLPTHASIFTGLRPPSHGVRDNGLFHVSDEAMTLAERLAAEGYRTHAFVSAMVLHRRYNLDQGFDGYDDQLWAEHEPVAFQFRERSAPHTMNRVLKWLGPTLDDSSRDAAPLFLWVHFFDPHAPHAPPAETLATAAPPYDGEITEVDRQVGRLVDMLDDEGVLDDTLIVLTSDHGESLGEHGESTHSVFIYESTVHVPLIFRYPRVLPSGKTVEGPMGSIDVMPTILGLVGESPGATQGLDMSAPLLGDSPFPSVAKYSESMHPKLAYGMAPLRGIREGPWTYIRAPRPELYDRRSDPGETRNLLDETLELEPKAREAAEAQANTLDQRLAALLENDGGQGAAAKAKPLDEQTTAMLQALGYLGEPGVEKGLEGMDPKDGNRILERIEDGRRHYNAGEYAQCVEDLKAVLKELPSNVFALNTLAACELKAGNPQRAQAIYTDSLAVEPRQHLALVQLGRLLLSQGKPEEARRMFRDALRVLPDSVEAMSLMGYLERSIGNTEEALRWFDQAIETEPSYPQPYLGRGDLALYVGNVAEAKKWYDDALELQPQNPRAALQAGVCALKMGDLPGAESLFLTSTRADPSSWYPLYMLATARALQNDADGAFRYLEEARLRGFSDRAALTKNASLASLAGDPRMEKLLTRIASPPN